MRGARESLAGARRGGGLDGGGQGKQISLDRVHHFGKNDCVARLPWLAVAIPIDAPAAKYFPAKFGKSSHKFRVLAKVALILLDGGSWVRNIAALDGVAPYWGCHLERVTPN